jgi:hypothetical protein
VGVAGQRRRTGVNQTGLVTGLLREEEEDRMLELNRQAFGGRDLLASREDLAWRRDENPAGRAVVPVVRDEEGRLAGFLWIVPLRLQVDGQVLRGATGTNLVVDPAYRGTFAFVRLLREFRHRLAEHAMPLHFSFVSEARYRSARKREPASVTTVPMLVKTLDWLAAAAALERRIRLPSAAPRLARWLLPSRVTAHPPARESGFRIVEMDPGDVRVDAFWSAARGKYRCLCVRDSAYLAWRFSPRSGRRYRVLGAEGPDGALLGYVVRRTAVIRGVTVGLIVDILLRGDTAGASAGPSLVRDTERTFREQGVAVSSALLPGFSEEHALLRALGYRAVPALFSPRPFRLEVVRRDPRCPPVQAAEWYVTYADWEAY